MSRATCLLVASVCFILGAAGCAGCDKKEDTKSREKLARELVRQAKADITAKRYSQARQKCYKAEEYDDSYDEAKYCIVIADVGELAKATSDIVDLIVSQLAPAPYRPMLEIPLIIDSIIGDIEGNMAEIDVYAYKLAAFENPHFQIESFPLDFDIKGIVEMIDPDELQISGTLNLDLGGTWDKSQILVMGSAFNAVQGVLDYVLSHSLILDNTDISFTTTEDVANFLGSNPNLLTGSDKPGALARLKGDDTRKGLRTEVLAALSFLVGRESELERVSPAHGGLVEAIKASAKEDIGDAVVNWVDANGDGIPEEVGVPAIAQLKDQIRDGEGKPIIEGETFRNPLSEDTWKEIIAFGKAMRDNVEAGGGTPVGIADILQLVVKDLQADYASTRLLHKDVPEVVAIDPGTFLKAPKYIGDMLPYYYYYAAAATPGVEHADLAVETELYSAPGNYVQKAGKRYGDPTTDFAHFTFPDNDEYSAQYSVGYYDFAAFTSEPENIPADGVAATAKTPRLWYFALQDPTFGGFLTGDPEFDAQGKGGNYAPLTNFTLNKGLNKLLKYYCIDTTDFSLDMFREDAAIYANNPISECNQ